MTDYKTSNNKRCRYTFVIIDILSTYTWCISLKKKYDPTKREEISKNFELSKRITIKLKSDRRKDFYNAIFENFLKANHIHHYSRFTDEGLSIAEESNSNLLEKKPFFEKGKQ